MEACVKSEWISYVLFFCAQSGVTPVHSQSKGGLVTGTFNL